MKIAYKIVVFFAKSHPSKLFYINGYFKHTNIFLSVNSRNVHIFVAIVVVLVKIKFWAVFRRFFFFIKSLKDAFRTISNLKASYPWQKFFPKLQTF